ncbi:DsbA family oxidoreductase [Micromonospora sp. BQ11]|uniref:DsbA family oxidoreductase n=1 Tax=Micromonospora sp. BQ11 TaxID=3452212 RepID=UPI003F8B1BA8
MTTSVFGRAADRLSVDVWSDIICPWCAMGQAQLNQAIERFPHRSAVDVTYHSFELMPELPVGEVIPVHDMLVRDKGFSRPDAEAMTAQIATRGAQVGLELRFDKALTTNTRTGQRLIHFAGTAGRQQEMVQRLHRAYLTDGLNIGDHDTLADLAAEVGLDRAAALAAIDSGAFEEQVAADIRQARQLGINGVPFFVLDNAYAVSGAQPVETLLQALHTAWDARLAPAV